MDDTDALDDRTVVLAVQYLTEDLQSGQPEPVKTVADARLVIAALLARGQATVVDASEIIADDHLALATARRALAAAAADDAMRSSVRDLLADPPRDEQMSVEAAVTSAVVLAFLVSWLQTKVELRISRRDHKTEVDFSVSKEAADGQTLRMLASAVRTILGFPAVPHQVLPGKAPTDEESDKGAAPLK
jgi:hypothetical protein